MNILALFTLLRRVDTLERQVKRLEATMQAEATFRRRAWQALTEAERPALERCERALRILAAYDQTAPAVIMGDWLVTAGDWQALDPAPINEDTVVYCRSDSTA